MEHKGDRQPNRNNDRNQRHYQGQAQHQDQYSGEKKHNRGHFGGNTQFGSPRKSGVAAPNKGPITLITNNFRIRSRNHGIIYTYRVDFIEGPAQVNPIKEEIPQTRS